MEEVIKDFSSIKSEEECSGGGGGGGEMTDLESDLVFIILLEAVFPTGDGVGLHTVSHREAVSCPHQDGVVRRT